MHTESRALLSGATCKIRIEDRGLAGVEVRGMGRRDVPLLSGHCCRGLGHRRSHSGGVAQSLQLLHSSVAVLEPADLSFCMCIRASWKCVSGRQESRKPDEEVLRGSAV